jgi:hypothetical protein
MRVRGNAGCKSSKNLENCIKKRESRENLALPNRFDVNHKAFG